MLSSKINLSYTILMHIWKTFVADFFCGNVFCNLYFMLFHTFLYKLSLKVCFLHNTVELLETAYYLKKATFYIRWEQNYISKLHSMMTHNLISWFKWTERRKTCFLKKPVENADLRKAKQWPHKIVLKIRFCSSFKHWNSATIVKSN